MTLPKAAHLPIVHSGSIIDNFREVLKNIDIENCEVNDDNAFYICDLAEIYRQHLRWNTALKGRIEAFVGKYSRRLCRLKLRLKSGADPIG